MGAVVRVVEFVGCSSSSSSSYSNSTMACRNHAVRGAGASWRIGVVEWWSGVWAGSAGVERGDEQRWRGRDVRRSRCGHRRSQYGGALGLSGVMSRGGVAGTCAGADVDIGAPSTEGRWG